MVEVLLGGRFMLYEIKREERENHKGHSKACLYIGTAKAAVCKDGRVIIKTSNDIPECYIEDLKAEWAKILAEEGPAE